MQMSPVVRAPCRIVFRNLDEILALHRAEFTHHFGRRAYDETSIGKYLALGDERAGPYKTTFADDCAVEHNRLYADQRAVADHTAVQHGLMADRHPGPNRKRKSWIGVQHRAVLHVACGANADGFVVPS